MKSIQKYLALWAVAIVTIMGMGGAFAQATPESVLTTEAGTLVTAGTNVGLAALAIFAALLVFGVVKRFFMAGK